MNPVCIWNRAFRWLFAITTFFLSASFMWNTHVQFQKMSTVSCSFKKLSPVSCADSKNHVTFSVLLVKPSVILQKKTRLPGVILKACKKTFFRVAKCWNSCHFTFFGRFSETFFFGQTFFQNCNFESTFYVVFFFVFSKFTPVQRILSNSNETDNGFTETFWNYLQTICNCHSFTETGCKKKVVIGVKSPKSPVS